MDWPTIEDAIQAWVKAGTGLDDAKVIWSRQEGEQPSQPFVSMYRANLDTDGIDFVSSFTDLTRPAGQEVEQRVQGNRQFMLSVNAYTAQEAIGNGSAFALMSKLKTSAALPSQIANLGDAGLSIFDFSQIRDLSAIDNALWESRAQLDIHFYVAESVSEYSGYIDEVHTTGTITQG